MKPGNVIYLTHFTHVAPRVQLGYRTIKGKVYVMVLLGIANKDAADSFDVDGALRSLGWKRDEEIAP